MATLTLLTKASFPKPLEQIENKLNAAFEGLDVEFQILRSSVNGWVQISVSGEDETIAKNFIAKEIGICPQTIDAIKDATELKGYITRLKESKEALIVDVGVFEPKTAWANVPLAGLQAKLAGGMQVDLKKIAELYGFSDGFPVNIKVTSTSEGNIGAELSESQVEKFTGWRDSLLDRLIILRSPLDDVEKTLERTGLSRDVILVESLGMFEHVLTCKLGTDAAGLISRIGRYMRNARFAVINPKKILKFLSE
jgi:hypothetical protein